tara:strand:- start:531 stop:806 length:276 start_codon:yes stop_codon:yes gene_type:complete
MTFDCYTINHRGDENYCVYGWGEYPEYSVLAGQPRKVFLNSYKTIEAAQEAYPEAKVGNRWTEPQVSVNHLPGEDDPVPGGMYLDDYDDGI